MLINKSYERVIILQTLKKENLKSWDLLGYIESVVGQKAKKSGNNTYKFKMCPLCGCGDHFTVNAIQNYFNTWGNCSKGGTIVDFYMAYNTKTQIEAITELLGNEDIFKRQQLRKKIKLLLNPRLMNYRKCFNLVLIKDYI